MLGVHPKKTLYFCTNKHNTDMKKKLKLVGFVTCLIVGCYFGSTPKNNLPSLLLENVEALAYGEHGNGANCYGDGSVECYGYWVEMKIEGLSLE